MLRNIVTLLVLLCLSACGTWWGGTPEEVIVGRGDTLYSISKRYDLQLRDLIDANNLKPPYTLRIGQVLRVPVSNYHIVKRGDTLYAVSRRYGISPQQLATYNGLNPPYGLNVGQKLLLSGRSTAGSSYASSKTATTKPTYISASNTSSRNNYASAAPASKNTANTLSATVSKSRKTKFIWPVRGTIISKFGTIGKGRANDGINIKAAQGTAVKAADKGSIAYAGNELKGFGNLILIRHDDGWITAYAHNEKLLVKKGQRVVRGEKIATVGATGGVNSPQLHFEIRAGKNPVNPTAYLQ